MSVKKTGPAILMALALCAGCSTKGVIQTAQGGVDRIADRYGARGYVDGAREGLAEAEAEKVGRVLLPRGFPADPAEIYTDFDGALLTNGVVLIQTYQRRQQIVDRGNPLVILPRLVPSTNAPAASNGDQDPTFPATQPHAGATDENDAALDRAEAKPVGGG